MPLASIRRLIVGVLLLAALAPSTAEAQRTESRNVSIAFEPGSPTRDGYADAQVEVTYAFGVCSDQVTFFARYNPIPRMLVGNHRYWLNGRQYEVPPHIAPPRLNAPTIRGTIRGNGFAREINFIYATANVSPDCSGGEWSFAPTSNFWPRETPADRRLAILNGFGLDQRGMLPPLRNGLAEAHILQVIAKERADSASRAREAESRLLAARRDSTQRALAEKSRRDSIANAEARRRAAAGAPATGAAATGAAAGTKTGTAASGAAATAGGAASGTTGGKSAPREPTVEEREAAARAAEREAEARRAEELRRQLEAREERARQDSIIVQEGAEALVALGTAVAPAVDKMFESLEGTGFSMGLNFSSSYLPGDAGRFGGTLGWAHPTTGSLVGYFDFSFEVGSAEENVAATKGVAFTVGAPIPRMSLPVGVGTLRPHLGMTFVKTAHPDENFGLSEERQLLMLGILWSRRGTHLRLDSTIWEGKPTFGLAIFSTL